MLHVGRVPAWLVDDADRSLLAELAATWTPAGFAVLLPDDVLAWRSRKLLSNLANSVQALVGPGGGIDPVVAAADGEARRVLDAAGIAYLSDFEEQDARARSFSIAPVPASHPSWAAPPGSHWHAAQATSRATS